MSEGLPLPNRHQRESFSARRLARLWKCRPSSAAWCARDGQRDRRRRCVSFTQPNHRTGCFPARFRTITWRPTAIFAAVLAVTGLINGKPQWAQAFCGLMILQGRGDFVCTEGNDLPEDGQAALVKNPKRFCRSPAAPFFSVRTPVFNHRLLVNHI